MIHEPGRYRAFLLTLCGEPGRERNLPRVWRFRLEDPRTGQQRGFASLEALVDGLRQMMADAEEERRAEREG